MARPPTTLPAIAPALGLREDLGFCGEIMGTLPLVFEPGGTKVVDETGGGLSKEVEVVGKPDNEKSGKSIKGIIGGDQPIAAERDEDERTDTVENCEEDVVEGESESTT